MGTRIHGEGRETMEWMTCVLKPYIDEHFRTIPSREATAIGGSSMGGLMSLYAVTMYNDVYSRAACVSPTLMIVEEPLRKEISARSLTPDTRIYLSWGDREGGDDPHSPFAEYVSSVNHRMQDFLNSKGALTGLFLQEGGRHCEADWEKQLPVFMNYLWL
jgi:predicted alpha/beta superfamily hydrolase